MKTIFSIIIFTSLVFQTQKIYSQNAEVRNFKHSIGIQYNHGAESLNSFFFGSDFIHINVFALRYAYSITPSIKIGPEISVVLTKVFNNDGSQNQNIFNSRYGIFGRYSLTYFNVFRPIVEGSVYYSHNNSWSDIPMQGYHEFRSGELGVYIAPGASIYLFKNRVSLDLMYKISNIENFNYKHGIISFKLNYNFDISKKH
ncbi:MAG TPA: hypothetical protein PLO05_02760 [Bacteroidales bacterium]|jgi:hypothetical protein|nr:hypothetical protein [Bacteroidales bacterium]MDY0160841.1 hypothetical protein [Bacteroidales bacterium]HRW21247.1 hypothetical protein [Bacteroidales bacterium]HXK81063.1 hypothetical protein [Bacteroidales bacterium]